jgi:hypothetical protein
MTTLLVLQALQGPPPPAPPWFGGRIVTLTNFHVGVRPAAFVSRDEYAVGLTVQVSTR